MEILGFDRAFFVIKASTSFTYSHDLEIKFYDIFYLSINDEWSVDTSSPFLFQVEVEELFWAIEFNSNKSAFILKTDVQKEESHEK